MNREVRIAQRIYEDTLTRRVLAGLPEPPPAMVDEIYRWAKAQEGANDAAAARNSLGVIRENVEDWRRSLERKQREDPLGVVDSGEKAVEYLQRMLDFSQEALEETEEMLRRGLADAKLFPGVKIRKWRRTKRKFKANTTGWKYNKLLANADPTWLRMADNLIGVITVELTQGSLQGSAKAYWKTTTATLRIATGGDLKSVIKHELMHWAQAYMRLALKQESFGKPSRKIRTPEIKQGPTKELKRELKRRGIEPDEIHDLDDVEFYTELVDAVDEFKRKLSVTKVLEFFGSKRGFFDVFVGIQDPGKRTRAVSKFFQTLKKHAKGKWKKAVKELAKAVL